MPQSAARVASATARIGATPVLGVAGAMAGGWPGKNIKITKRSQFYFGFSCLHPTGGQRFIIHERVKNRLALFRRKWLRLGGDDTFGRTISVREWSFARPWFRFLELRSGEILCKSVQSAGGRFWRGSNHEQLRS